MNLDDDLAQRVAECRTMATRNYYAAFVVLAVSLGSSALAAIGVAAELFTKEMNAVLAVLPGLAVASTTTFRFEERSNWWWQKAKGLDGLHRELRDQGVADADVSRKLTDFLIAHERQWPGFGKPPG